MQKGEVKAEIEAKAEAKERAERPHTAAIQDQFYSKIGIGQERYKENEIKEFKKFISALGAHEDSIRKGEIGHALTERDLEAAKVYIENNRKLLADCMPQWFPDQHKGDLPNRHVNIYKVTIMPLDPVSSTTQIKLQFGRYRPTTKNGVVPNVLLSYFAACQLKITLAAALPAPAAALPVAASALNPTVSASAAPTAIDDLFSGLRNFGPHVGGFGVAAGSQGQESKESGLDFQSKAPSPL